MCVKGNPMFAIHTNRPAHRQHHHYDGWELADRTAGALAVAAVILAAAWLGMTI